MSVTTFTTVDGRLATGSKAQVDAMLDRLAAVEKPRLAVFVHGGLVNHAAGMNSASALAQMLHPLIAEGWEFAAPIWQSGVDETLRINWAELQDDPRFVRIILRIAAWLERRFGNKLIAGSLIDLSPPGESLKILQEVELPDAEQVQAVLEASPGELDRVLNVEDLTDQQLAEAALAQDVLADTELVGLLEAGLPMIDSHIVRRARAVGLMPPTSTDKRAVATPAAWVIAMEAARIGWRVLKRYILKRDHGFGPTVVEEVLRALYLTMAGAAAWRTMKDDARQHFDGDGAGTYLLERLGAIARGGKDLQMLAIGHSAGAVFCGRLAVQTLGSPANLSIGHILLAPAIRLDEAADAYTRGRYDGLRIFTMDNAHEKVNALDDQAFGKVYSRSLLYLISGALEDRGKYPDAPILGMQRHLAPRYSLTSKEGVALRSLKAVLGRASDPLVYSPSRPDAAPGHRSRATRHGGFWGEEATVESIMSIAREGFSA